MMDLEKLKASIDLLSLASQHTLLRKAASSGGGEWAGPCPFCGGQDRFRVQPQAPGGGRWLCRGCTQGKWQDGVAFGQRLWPGQSFQEVCERLGGARSPGSGPAHLGAAHSRANPKTKSGKYRHRRTPARDDLVSHPSFPDTGTYPLLHTAPHVPHVSGSPAYTPPDEAWQSAARQAVQSAERALWGREGQAALAYLHSRGLKDETIRYWRLGWSRGMKISLAGGLWIPRGILIPCIALDQIWYLKVSLLPGQRVKCQGCGEQTPARQPCPHCGGVNKYRGVKGNRSAAIYGAGELRGASLALFVEGEFDAMIAWQELSDVAAVCTLGAATNLPDLATWGAVLAPVETLLAAYDADAAGRQGLAALQSLSERVVPCPLPAGAKDVNDFYINGGDLWGWIKEVVEALGLGEP